LIYGEGVSGQVTDIAIEAKELENTKTRLTEILAKHTGNRLTKFAPIASETFICPPRKPRNTGWWTKCSPSENKHEEMTTPTGKDGKEITQCVFCAKGKKEGLRLIGGQGVYVCEECVRNSHALLSRINEEEERRAQRTLPKPSEIKKCWTIM
jgi:hypothetical protein